MTQATPATHFDGFINKSPQSADVKAAADELIQALRAEGWTLGDKTMVWPLVQTVKVGYLVNVPTHVTIGHTDIEMIVRQCFAEGVDGHAAALAKLKARVAFHVTVSEADALYASTNPRWFSDSGKWAAPSDVDTSGADFAAAATAGTSKMGRR